MKTIGFFGGTFDPVHRGHLTVATELKAALNFDEMRLVPCHLPPHRQAPGCSSADRAYMVSLAASQTEALSVDERELQRTSVSYTIDTLMELRAELGDEVSISWCVGMDSLVNLSTWHRWQELLNYAHLVVVARPGFIVPSEGDVASWLHQHVSTAATLHECSNGSVVIETLSLLPISATDIRAKRAAGLSAQDLLPDSVWQYIEEKHLYLTEEVES